jgi:hypothetical protein
MHGTGVAYEEVHEMTRTTIRRSLGTAAALALLSSAQPAAAQTLPGLPPLPELPGLPGLPGVPVDPSTGLPVDPGSVLPGGVQPGSGAENGGSEGGASGTGAGLDSTGLDPVISGPAKARTVRVDSKGRFRVAGVGVGCPMANPSACSVSVLVTTANGSTLRFVKRTFTVQPGATLSLKKLKVSKKALKALRAMKVARVVSAISASRPGGAKTSRAIGLKLKPAKR